MAKQLSLEPPAGSLDRSTLVILRLPSVIQRTALSRSTICARVAEGSFPKPIALGPRAIGWIELEIEDWITQQIVASRCDKTVVAEQ